MVRVQFADVVQQDGQYVILLLEEKAQKLLGIRTGFTEGTMLAWLAGGRPQIWNGPRRPSTFDFLANLAEGTGLRLRAVAIRALKHNVFYGVVQFIAGENKVNVDARASDAVALALQLDLPIFADQDLVAGASWNFEAVYRRTTLGKSTEALVGALRTFWNAQDSRVYLNAADGGPGAAPDAAESSQAVPVSLVDIRRKDEFVSSAIFWDQAGRRMLPVRMTSWEAANLAWLHGGTLRSPGQPRCPQTYQLIGSILDAAGVSVQNVQIRDMRSGIVFAGIEAQAGEKLVRVDARPVDAVGLGLHTQAPIFVSEGVLKAASVAPNTLYRSRQQIGQGLQQIVAEMRKNAGGQGEKSGFLQKLGVLLRG